MGIHGLPAFIRKNAPKAVEKVSLSSLAEKTGIRSVVMDIFTELYRRKTVVQGKHAASVSVANFDPNMVTALTVLDVLSLIQRLQMQKIEVIVVFDGERPLEKMQVVEERNDQRRAKEQRLRELEKQLEVIDATSKIAPFERLKVKAEISQIIGDIVRITPGDVTLLKRSLARLGIKTYTPAPGIRVDAEKLCVDVCRTLKCDAVWTSDSDTLCFGGETIICPVRSNFSGSGGGGGDDDGGDSMATMVEIFRLAPLLKSLPAVIAERFTKLQKSMDRAQKKRKVVKKKVAANIELSSTDDEDGSELPNKPLSEVSHSLFVDFCILCGCDYNVSIAGVGPMRAFDTVFVRQEPLEKFVESRGATERVRVDVCRNKFAEVIDVEKCDETGKIEPLSDTELRTTFSKCGILWQYLFPGTK